MIATTSFVIAASSLFALSLGAPLPRSVAATPRSLAERAAYRVFGGDGSTTAGWPAESAWLDFESLWTANVDIMQVSCSQFSQDNDDANTEIPAIKQALIDTEKDTGIKKEFLLAIMMQESKGCVRAPTTNYGYNNPGLMQSFQGQASCNPSGTGVKPCPDSTIKQMIMEGAGVGTEFGLKQALAQAKVTDVSQYYKAARIYNSGSIDTSGNLGAGIATHCYASDIANRLTGWASDSSACSEGTVGSLTGSAGSTTGGGDSNGSGNNEATTPTPAATEAPKTETPAPTQGASNPTAPKAQGAAANCSKWYTVKSGDTCSSTGADLATLRKLNTSLNADCTNLWLGSAYCIAA